MPNGIENDSILKKVRIKRNNSKKSKNDFESPYAEYLLGQFNQDNSQTKLSR